MRYRKPRILLLGDVMLDEWIYVTPRDYNPEGAAIAVIGEEKDRGFSLGGAGVVATLLKRLQTSVKFMTQLSDNSHGMLAHSVMHRERLSCRYARVVEDWDIPIKRRYVNSAGMVIFRHDEEASLDDMLAIAGKNFDLELYTQLVSRADAVLVVDYDKGYLTNWGQQIIAEAAKAGTPVIVGAKPVRMHEYLGATLVKVNAKEAAEFLDADFADIEQNPTKAAEILCHTAQARAAVITVGSRGSACAVMRTSKLAASFEMASAPCMPAVKNCVCAGDAFLAGLALDLAAAGLQNCPTLDMMRGAMAAANAVSASYLSGGLDNVLPAVPVMARHDLFCAENTAAKILSLDTLLRLCQAWRQNGEEIVFTNGCFDLLHDGHLNLLQQAKQRGTKLIVAVNTDASVRALKGAERPVQAFKTRSELLASLSCVDAVIALDEEDGRVNPALRSMITSLQPDLLVKGAEYAESEIVGWEEMLNRPNPGRVWRCPMVQGRSTTTTITHIKNRAQNA